jgi:hypothetical protein
VIFAPDGRPLAGAVPPPRPSSDEHGPSG